MKLLVVVAGYRVTDLTIDCLRSLSTEIHRVPGPEFPTRTDRDTWCVPQSGVVHLVGQTTDVRAKTPKRFPEYALQARGHYFLKKHWPLNAALADAGYITGFGERPVQNPALPTGAAKKSA